MFATLGLLVTLFILRDRAVTNSRKEALDMILKAATTLRGATPSDVKAMFLLVEDDKMYWYKMANFKKWKPSDFYPNLPKEIDAIQDVVRRRSPGE